MIVLTGAAGFIGSCLLHQLNKLGYEKVVLVDEFDSPPKNKNLFNKKYQLRVHRDQLFDWLHLNHHQIEFIFHLGARTDTTEKNRLIFDQLNLSYSKKIWHCCCRYDIPLVYASSAATYGLGEFGFLDSHHLPALLQPLNPYGSSKNEFDKWALYQNLQPPRWAGLKFFNVYGPNEFHKGRMASVIFHAFHQIKQSGSMKLFKSDDPNFKDGEQSRDFIYVKDVVKICSFFLEQIPTNGLYNVGTGEARTFWDLVTNTFKSMGLAPNIDFIDTPIDIRDTYQYFTEANIQKLRKEGYSAPFYTLEDGVAEYVQDFLLQEKWV